MLFAAGILLLVFGLLAWVHFLLQPNVTKAQHRSKGKKRQKVISADLGPSRIEESIGIIILIWFGLFGIDAYVHFLSLKRICLGLAATPLLLIVSDYISGVIQNTKGRK